jgi:hypothetical protein
MVRKINLGLYRAVEIPGHPHDPAIRKSTIFAITLLIVAAAFLWLTFCRLIERVPAGLGASCNRIDRSVQSTCKKSRTA